MTAALLTRRSTGPSVALNQGHHLLHGSSVGHVHGVCGGVSSGRGDTADCLFELISASCRDRNAGTLRGQALRDFASESPPAPGDNSDASCQLPSLGDGAGGLSCHIVHYRKCVVPRPSI